MCNIYYNRDFRCTLHWEDSSRLSDNDICSSSGLMITPNTISMSARLLLLSNIKNVVLYTPDIRKSSSAYTVLACVKEGLIKERKPYKKRLKVGLIKANV